MKSILFALAVMCLACAANAKPAERVQHLEVYSEANKQKLPVSVVLPSRYFTDKKAEFTVVYSLCGLGGLCTDYVKNTAEFMKEYTDRFDFILVCPHNGLDGWYFDAPGKMYETFCAVEVPAYIESHYRTKTDRLHRIIYGGSMGGHGALLLARLYPDKYQIVGSLAPAINLRFWGTDWKTGKRTLTECNNAENAAAYKDKGFKILIDAGVRDSLCQMARDFHEDLKKEGVDHVYVERDGAHDEPYWTEALKGFLNFAFDELKKLEADEEK
ncbi:MAG: hypothetical protein J6X53_00740 [Abditibacteriota bacterium]|nr:hypothetical protein [Abditibacteriota bacterium]MBP5717495.1 hypothetical protein [Abditibacteriota bacterium]